MREGRPSITAELACAVRAVESMKPPHKRVCYDPYAMDFIGLWLRLIAKSRVLTRLILWEAERMAPGVPGEVIGRTRYIDDCLKRRIDDGIEQLVVLGAGYDSRSYRFEELKGRVKSFELDYPSTQELKLKRVKSMFGTSPDGVVYVPIDFNSDSMERMLFDAGYDRTLKTFFIWEGVTYYITDQAVNETLEFVVKHSGEGSSIFFDYAFKSVIEGHGEIKQVNRTLRAYELVAAPITSEHFVFGVEEGTIEEFLEKRGLQLIENVTGEFFESSYFAGVKQTRQVSRLCGFAHAGIGPKGDSL
jgi:methyltransferase (TIGR00027 family)